MSAKHPDRLAAITSGFIAALALAISVYNVVLQRQQIRAQVWPYLEWSYDNTEGFAFRLQNTGVGPAIIKSVQVTVDGVAIPSWRAAMKTVAEKTKLPGRYTNTDISGRVLGAGVLVQPMNFTPEHRADDAERQAQVDTISGALSAWGEHVRAQICYCSTLDECWLLLSDQGTKPVSACPRVEHPFLGSSASVDVEQHGDVRDRGGNQDAGLMLEGTGR
jgi:hypothetical protein